jgi:cell division septal protein FtsQ
VVRLLAATSRDSTARAPRRERVGSSTAVRAAVASAGAVVLLACLALSPWMRVHTVAWTGTVRVPPARCTQLEGAALGQPLLLLSEAGLRRALQMGDAPVRLRLRRHLPHTLEVHVEPRRAVARLGRRAVVDRRGRVLGPEHLVDGLTQLEGFDLEPDGERLDARGRALLERVRDLLDEPLLVPERVRQDGDELELVLADSGTRVRLDATRVESQLLKLRILEGSLGSEPMPESIDLRFQGLVVVRPGGGTHAAARRR